MFPLSVSPSHAIFAYTHTDIHNPVYLCLLNNTIHTSYVITSTKSIRAVERSACGFEVNADLEVYVRRLSWCSNYFRLVNFSFHEWHQLVTWLRPVYTVSSQRKCFKEMTCACVLDNYANMVLSIAVITTNSGPIWRRISVNGKQSLIHVYMYIMYVLHYIMRKKLSNYMFRYIQFN